MVTLTASFLARRSQRLRSRRRALTEPSLVERLEERLAPAVFTVTTTADNGDNLNPPPGSLRAAILGVNASVDPSNTINFNSGTGTVIVPPTALPNIGKTVTIDGFTQPGTQPGFPGIVLNGDNTGVGVNGLTLDGASGCLIRGLQVTRFSNPSSAGIRIIGGSNNRIQGDFVGTNGFASGSGQNRNEIGIVIQGGSTGNFIGTDGDGVNDAAEGNLIAGNIDGSGVEISGPGTTGNHVAGNKIGTTLNGLQSDRNENDIVIMDGASDNTIGGTSFTDRNIISGAEQAGVLINGGTNNLVSGNFIGTNVTGMAALGNAVAGVFFAQGGSNTLEGNVISGNNQGILLNSANNQVLGNFIGTNPDGTAALGNTFDGIDTTVMATGTTISANVISGNGGQGIVVDGDGNSISDNKIGTDVTGTVAIANTGDGVLLGISAANNVINGNLISGNGFSGVEMKGAGTSNNQVTDNRIGTDAAGTTAIPNVIDGVFINSGAFGNTIGGTTTGTGNVIAFNSKGVVVGSNLADTATGNNILGNSIFGNTSLGIDLGNDGVTPNQPVNPAPGPNDLQNFPVITGATSTTVSGTLHSTPGHTFTLEFFASTVPSGEGKTFLGTTTVTTDGAGDAAVTATLTTAIPPSEFVTATATDTATGDTSEFSAGFNASADLSVTKVAAPERVVVGENLIYRIVVTNAGPNIATGVIVTDTVPTGAAFVAAGTTQGTASESGGVVTATLGELASGATATVTIIVRPTATGTLSNVASVAGEQPDPNPDNNTTPPVLTPVDPTPVEPTADLSVTKVAVPARCSSARI